MRFPGWGSWAAASPNGLDQGESRFPSDDLSSESKHGAKRKTWLTDGVPEGNYSFNLKRAFGTGLTQGPRRIPRPGTAKYLD
jgi:hypothetical protein